MKNQNPYRPGTLYHLIAKEGARQSWPSRKVLAAHVTKLVRNAKAFAAYLTGSAPLEQRVRFAVDVVCYRGQQSNKGTESYPVGKNFRVRYVSAS